MTIPPRFLEEIRSRLTLSEVIGRKVKITRAGREYKACCPFHNEKSPSFYINDDKQFYHCFGCGAHGDVIGFTMRHGNLSFVEAVEGLAAEAGLQMPRPDPREVQRAEKAKDLYDLMETTTKWFIDQLYAPANKKILEYIEGRGLNAESLAAFRIGYAPADRQILRDYLKKQGFEDKDMIEAGLIKTSDKSPAPYVFFRERVIFPVTDRRGRVVAFGGRILPDHMRPPDQGDYKPAKYINSAETPLFDKGRMLYGESLARHAARDGAVVMVTEGYMDVIACHQAGFKGAVAPMGTALTEEQILSLWSMIPPGEKAPVLCFDGDDAGRRAAARACERILALLKPDQSVRFAFLPDGEDPDSLLKKGGKAALANIVESAQGLFDFIWAQHAAGRNFDNPESRAGLSKALQDKVLQIADKEVQSHYQQLVKDKIATTFFNRKGSFGRGFTPKQGPAKAFGILRPRRPAYKANRLYPLILLAAVLNHPYIYSTVEEHFGSFDTGRKGLDRLRQAIIETLQETPELDRQGLQNHLKDIGFEQEMGDILSESVYVHAVFASPKADSPDIAASWLAFFETAQDQGTQDEIKKGWRDALQSSSEDEEEKLKNMMRFRSNESRS